MSGSIYPIILLAPLLVLLTLAAAIDVRHRRIPNWLNGCIALTGLGQSFLQHHTVSPTASVLGMLAGLALPMVLLALNAIGGGDVKLMAAVGAWVGPLNVLIVFVLKDVIGLVLVLVQATAQRRLKALGRNSSVTLLNLLHIRHVGLETVQQTGLSCRSVDKPLPIAMTVLAAAVVLAFARAGGVW
jgi:prepilin peptidase CpaA